jgi:hypothetical protein
VRERAPFVAAGDPLPGLEPLVELAAGGTLAA